MSETTARKRLTAADRREAILADALVAFGEHGFDRASLDDVAARGGVSKALIYEHFGSKRDLQLAVLDTYVHELVGRVVDAIAAAGSDEERLRTGLDTFLEFAEQRPEALRLLTRNVADPIAGELLDRLREEAATTVAAQMAANAPPRQEGDLELETTVALMAHLLAGGIQFMAGWWLDHPEVSREAVVDVAMDLYWLGFERLNAGERWRR